MRVRAVRWSAGAVLGLLAAVVGCSSSSESAERDKLTANVGVYSPPPAAAAGPKPRVGVPPFNVSTAQGAAPDLNDLAADQMTTLLDQTGRFDVIERAQMKQLLNEQSLEGIVKAGELAKAGQVRGVDYLLLGKVTNLRVKAEHSSSGFGVAQITGGAVNLGGMDIKNSKTVLTTECGVDIRLVDPTTGQLMTSNFSEFNRSDSAGSMGVTVLGANADSGADVQLSEDDKGKVLRLALDDAVRKSLPKIDAFIAAHPGRLPDGPPAAAAVVPAAPAPTPTNAVVAKHFCPSCGKEVTVGAKFCPSCGAKLE